MLGKILLYECVNPYKLPRLSNGADYSFICDSYVSLHFVTYFTFGVGAIIPCAKSNVGNVLVNTQYAK